MKASRQEVEKFIDRFRTEETKKVFTEGCCYWFARILEERFRGCIYYNPIDNHFATSIGGILYDITGEIKKTSDWVMWFKYKWQEPLDTERLLKNCIYF